MAEWRLAEEARTLMAAHEALSALRPDRHASCATWEDYYQRSAAVYEEISEIDRGHHHEAQYWAARERRRAEELAQRVTTRANSTV